MLACQQGDVAMIRQHLLDKTGRVTDTTNCTGATPLLVSAIEDGGQDLC
jgi:hypothetical protein